MSPQAHISVIRVHAEEEFGNFVSRDADGFTFYDIDRKVNVKLRYQDVKKIRNGYGGYNGLHRRHVDRHREWTIVAVAIVGLGLLIGAAAKSQ